MKTNKKIMAMTVLWLFIFGFTINAQTNSLQEYLITHKYSFTLKEGFDAAATSMLKEKLPAYKFVLQAQGGSHFQDLYNELAFTWFDFLSTNFGTTVFFGEAGHSASVQINRFLKTGDTSNFYLSGRPFWPRLRKLNQSQPEAKRIYYYGVDFESPNFYIAALQMILPLKAPTPDIAAPIDLIKNADPRLRDCDYIVGINDKLKKELAKNKPSFVDFFGDKYRDFERMIMNGTSCKDTRKDRNPNMAARFQSFDEELNGRMYYGELGTAHTLLNVHSSAASLINNSDQYKGKVAVVNLYCDNCSTKQEGPSSNWQLSKIETDIIKYFLPLCSSDFTLFDLTSNDPVIKKFNACGPFLIIARNQR
jgi:hypothetical protein